MRYTRYIATNFAYGTGPYLRTTDLALAVNNALERAGQKRGRIIVPLVYGAKQKRVMQEEFGDILRQYPQELIFDEKLGAYLESIFYGGGSYEGALKKWILNVDDVSRNIQMHLHKTYGDRIIMELHRSPRVLYNIAPSYFTSFASISEIFTHAIGNDEIAVDDDVFRQALPKITAIEQNHRMHFLSDPGTFSYNKERGHIFTDEISSPPMIHPPKGNTVVMQRGVFVTVTGIPGLERLYKEAMSLGITVYTNDVDAVPFGKKALPSIIPNPNIVLQFARSGWSSVWLSQVSGTPLVVPGFDTYDDPEIYFNNICIEKLGLGIVYRGQSLGEILREGETLQPKIEKYNQGLLQRFGTFDGIGYCAERITQDFLGFF